LLRLVPDIVNVWIVVLIIGREFLISGLRSIAASEGFTIEASELGKLKMVVQIVSVVAAMLAIRWDTWNFNLGFFSFVFDIDLVAKMAIWFMAAVSIISAVDYFWAFWKKIDKRVERRRRRPFILSRRKKRLENPPLSAQNAERIAHPAEANNPAKAH
jgi:CDP-diacylglycerol--glycerol-3-phosphate 3-phosphatidyltransferase